MASKSSRNPPSLSTSKSYDDWLKLLKIWRIYTDLEKEKQGPALILSLEGEAQDAALEISEEDLVKTTGLDTIIERLNRLYKKDSLITKYQALEKFETFKRPAEMNIQTFLNEFERRYYKTKSFGSEISDDILAYRLLKSANLSTQHEELTKATLTALTYECVKNQLKKTFSDSSKSVPIKEDDFIKTENTLLANQFRESLNFQEFNNPPQHETEARNDYYENNDQYDQEYDTFYYQNNYRPPYRRYQQPNHNSGYKPTNQNYRPPTFPNRFRAPNNQRRPDNLKNKKNPCDRFGKQLKCLVCESIYHFAQNCPETKPSETLFTQEVVLFQADYDHPAKMKNLVAESWNAAVLDSGASKTVAGSIWFENYKETLKEPERSKINYHNSANIYRFGDGNLIPAVQNVDIPGILGNRNVTINADIVPSDIPLLLSKKSMKKAGMKIDFVNDSAIILGQQEKLIVTESGHYTIPIDPYKTILNNVISGENTNITLITSSETSKAKTANKLHRQFSHPRPEKLIKLINSAGDPWKNDNELKEAIHDVSKNCDTCQIYRKPPPRPVVGLPMASTFLECVAMDLKFYNKKILLHIIDHATRLSASTVITSKSPEVVVKAIFKSWIQIWGTPIKFMSDNGGEFANKQFIDMCESLNIRVITTAAESPFSNGLVERHNLILSEMLDKTLNDDTNLDFELALSWCINAKNSLSNVHGFSPYQLVIGQNPKFPTSSTSAPPALTLSETSKIITDNISSLHKAREAFIAAESSEKIKRALSNNIRSSGDIKYFSGDSVYFKRAIERRWRGPAKVLGQDGQQVLVKYGSNLVRVHPCRLSLERNLPATEEQSNCIDTVTNQRDKTMQKKHKIHNQDEMTESDTDDENHRQHIPTENQIVEQISDQVNHDQHKPPNENQLIEPVTDIINNSTNENNVTLKPKLHIRFKYKDNDEYNDATLVNRAGKSTGKYSLAWNAQLDDGSIKCIDFERDVTEYKAIEKPSSSNENQNTDNVNEEMHYSNVFLTALELTKSDAKQTELQNWKDQGVYSEVEDDGQSCVSVRWVITKKIINNKTITKARLCARGFEELQNFRTDSPCCSKIGIRSTLGLIASQKWTLKSIDVKVAFLQGKQIERTVYIRPPSEAKTNKIWKLIKCVYGLADASRYWYLRVKEELIRLGANISNKDPGVFYWYSPSGELTGVLICHVDDMIYGGNNDFENTVIRDLKQTFKFGTEDAEAFTYVGIELTQQQDYSIILSQQKYIDSITEIVLPKQTNADKNALLNDKEKTLYRSTVGQLNWVSTTSRPDISFQTCEASTKFQSPTISDVLKVNKVIKQLHQNKTFIKIPCLDISSVELLLFTDASFKNLPNGGSQGGQILFLCDKNNNSLPLHWNSLKLKRVVRSTITAETLSMSDGCDLAIYTKAFLSEILSKTNLNVTAHTDNQSLYENVHSSRQTLEKRLIVDIAALREMVDRGEITLTWIEKQKQISDSLTKSGSSSNLLLEVLQNAKMIHL